MSIDVVSEAERAGALLNPLRLRIVEALREPNSASGLARELSIPRQKLNYHLRELEARGFLELVEERRRGNCTERVLRTKAASYLVAPRVLGALAAEPGEVAGADRFAWSYLVAVAAKAIRDLAALGQRAERSGKKLPTFCLQSRVRFASKARQEAFARELTEAVERIVAKHHDDEAPGGRRFELFLGAYPTATVSKEAS